MTEKQILSRILHKYDTEANWNRATTFVPKKGELIIYSDLSSFKVGDGSTKLADLKFFDEKLEKLIADLSFDWNADEGETGYILNRTHYIGTETTYILTPTAITHDGYSYYLSTTLNLTVGQEYLVLWRNKRYTTTAQDISEWGGTGAIGLGNCSQIGGTETDAPFGIAYTSGVVECWPYDDSIEDLTLSIQGETFVYHKLDKNFLPDDVVYIELLSDSLDSKVDKVDGKDLSTNDYTTTEKNKLSGIATGAQVNIIETVKVNGTALTPSSKAVNIDLNSYATKTYADQAEADALSAAKTYANNLAGNYATKAQGEKADTAVQPEDIGTAAEKGVDTSISVGDTSTDLPTSAAVAAFVEGKGYTTNPGTVTSIVAGGGLEGGTITGSGTISHADTSSQASITASSRRYITGVTLDTYGHVTGLSTGTETVTDTNTTYTFAAAKSATNGNVKINLTAGGSGSGTQPITLKGAGSATVTSDASGVITVTGATIPTIPTSLKNPYAITIGSKTYDGSAAVSISAADLGLSNALHFIGTVTTLPTSGTNGDVVLLGNKEYVYSDGWVELGDGDSHALKTITISAGSGLTGGGDLSANRTISHADTSSVANVTASGRKYVTGLTFDGFGHVTAVTTGTETVTDTNTTYDLAASASSTNGNVKLNLTAGGSGSGTDAVTIKGSGATTVTTDANGVITISSTDKNDNTTYSAGTGLSLSGTTFNHSNSVTAKTTYNQATASPGYSGTFKITEPKYDAQGHITGVQVATITMPSAQTIPTYTLNSFGVTATSTELNYTDGVTSNIQTQLNARLTKILVEDEDYGPTLPESGTKGRIFFKTVE